jgi:hypothetical protein
MVNYLNVKKYVLSIVSENFPVSVSQGVSDTKSKLRDLSRLVTIPYILYFSNFGIVFKFLLFLSPRSLTYRNSHIVRIFSRFICRTLKKKVVYLKIQDFLVYANKTLQLGLICFIRETGFDIFLREILLLYFLLVAVVELVNNNMYYFPMLYKSYFFTAYVA